MDNDFTHLQRKGLVALLTLYSGVVITNSLSRYLMVGPQIIEITSEYFQFIKHWKIGIITNPKHIKFIIIFTNTLKIPKCPQSHLILMFFESSDALH